MGTGTSLTTTTSPSASAERRRSAAPALPVEASRSRARPSPAIPAPASPARTNDLRSMLASSGRCERGWPAAADPHRSTYEARPRRPDAGVRGGRPPSVLCGAAPASKVGSTSLRENAVLTGNQFHLGIDVGGTFTDAVLIRGETGRIETAKVPRRPPIPPRDSWTRCPACSRRARSDPDRSPTSFTGRRSPPTR